MVLQGKRIIITGGASGMGLTMVGGFARAGASVVSLDIDPAGQTIADEATAARPGSARFLACDIASEVEGRGCD